MFFPIKLTKILRWKPIDDPKTPKNFVEGLVAVSGAGDPGIKVRYISSFFLRKLDWSRNIRVQL